MAENFRPDLNVPLEEQINNPLLRRSALRVVSLLQTLPKLRVWNLQQKAPKHKDNSWYIGFVDSEDSWLMNTKLTPSDVNVEFRHPQYLPMDVVQILPWHNRSWQRASLNKHGDNSVSSMIRHYFEAIESDCLAGKVKQGGKSVAEFILCRLLEFIFPGYPIEHGKRPDDMRSAKNIPLQLDLHIPQLRLAIEVQGVQHFKEVWGPNLQLQENDKLKKRLCSERAIKLAWMNWDTLTKQLFRRSEAEKLQHLQIVLSGFLGSKYSFMWWKDMDTQEYE